jgi:hypothetical protein
MAVAEQSGTRILYINDVDATNSLLPAVTSSRRYLPGKETKGSIQVDATSIDEFVKSHRVETIHILKMDIQGGELMALEGAQRALKEIQMPLIYTEIMFVPHYEKQPLLNDIWDFLARYGYSMFDIYYLQRADNGQLKYANALFVSTEVRKFLNDARMKMH